MGKLSLAILMRKTIFLAVTISVSILVSGCGFHGSNVSGYVYEWVDQSKPLSMDNLKPVNNAYVVAIWTGTIPRPIDAGSTCLNVKLGKTDENGYYQIPGWYRIPRFYPVLMNEVAIRKYKSGYKQKEWTHFLVPAMQTADDRIRYIDSIVSIPCQEIGNDLYRELLPLYEAALQEAQSLKGVSPELRLSGIRGIQHLISKGKLK